MSIRHRVTCTTRPLLSTRWQPDGQSTKHAVKRQIPGSSNVQESAGCVYVRLVPSAQMPFRAEPLAACTEMHNTNLQHITALSNSTDLPYKADWSQETAQGKSTGNGVAAQAVC